MKKTIAIFAQEGLLLEALLAHWDAHLLNFQPVLINEDEQHNSVVFRNRPLPFLASEAVDAQSCALVIVLFAEALDASWLKNIHCPVLTDAQSQAQHAALHAAHAVPLAASLAMRYLFADVPLLQLNAVQLMSAAYFGKPAVDELASQTVKLFSAQAIKPRIFPQQCTFNVFPFTEESLQQVLLQQWSSVLDVQSIQLNLLQVPVFHGQALQLQLQLAKDNAKEVLKRWRALADVDVLEGEDAQEASMLNAAQQDGKIKLANFLLDSQDNQRVSLWLAFDDVQLFVRQGLISQAEILLKDYL